MKKLDVYLQEIKRQKISVDDLQHAAEILAATPQLPAELENPDLTREKREDLVRSLFPLAVRGIIEVLAQDQTMKMMPDLIKEAEAFEKPDKYLRWCWNMSKSRMKNRQPESGNFSRRNIRDGNSGL